MVVVASRFGFAALITVPPLIVAFPELVSAADVWMAPAAAMSEGLVSATLRVPAACAVGWMRNWSPAAGVAESTIDKPAAVSGFAAVPLPVSGTLAPVVVSVSV